LDEGKELTFRAELNTLKLILNCTEKYFIKQGLDGFMYMICISLNEYRNPAIS
jgi:hypothetical protein